MFDRTYQPGRSSLLSGMADTEGERVLVYRMGFGWVERRVVAAPQPVEIECEDVA